jgi:hypothetical protein
VKGGAQFYNSEIVKGYQTYVIGTKACMFLDERKLPSSFRIRWRVLDIDEFYYALRFEAVETKMGFTKENGVFQCRFAMKAVS